MPAPPPIGEGDIMKQLDELDSRLTALKIGYDKYFLGMEKFEPQKDRIEIGRIITELAAKFIRNTGAKFRRDQLKSKFLSYGRYWDRILKQIEDGTYRGHRVKAELHEKERLERERRERERRGEVAPADAAAGANGNGASAPAGAAPVNGKRPAAPPTPGARPDPVQRLLDQLTAARRQSGESTDGLTREKMAQVVQQQSAALKAKYNCKSVEFKVVVEGGKAKLKATPKS